MSDSRHELTRGLITLHTLDRWDRAAPHPEILFCRGKILRQLALKADYRVARILPRFNPAEPRRSDGRLRITRTSA